MNYIFIEHHFYYRNFVYRQKKKDNYIIETSIYEYCNGYVVRNYIFKLYPKRKIKIYFGISLKPNKYNIRYISYNLSKFGLYVPNNVLYIYIYNTKYKIQTTINIYY